MVSALAGAAGTGVGFGSVGRSFTEAGSAAAGDVVTVGVTAVGVLVLAGWPFAVSVGFAIRATLRRETVAVVPLGRRGVVATPGFDVFLRGRAVADDELDDPGAEGPAVLCESDEPASA